MPPSLPTVDIPLSGEVLVVGVSLGIGGIFAFIPFFLRFLPGLRRALFMHNTPLSDVPGCPEHYDEALICALNTLPDPNNFLSAYSYLPLDDGVRFRHPKMPRCRYFCMSLFAGLYDPVQDQLPPCIADHELTYNKDGSFDIAVCDEKDRPADIPASNWMPRQGVRDGLLVIRRFGVLPGQRVETPAFWSMHPDSPKQLKPTYTTYSGPQYAEKTPGHRFKRLLNLLKYLGISYSFLLLTGRWSLAEVNLMVLVAGAVPAAFIRLLYRGGWKRFKACFAHKTQGKLHEFIDFKALISYGKDGTKAHPHHMYYMCAFDANEVDLVIDGLLFPEQQKMWTFVVYNDYGMPHYHNLTDETIHTTPATSSSSKKEGGTAQAQAYRVVLTKDLSRHREGGGNVVDVSGLPHGVVLLRLMYPKSKAVFEQSKPTVTLLPVLAKKGSSSSKKQA